MISKIISNDKIDANSSKRSSFRNKLKGSLNMKQLNTINEMVRSNRGSGILFEELYKMNEKIGEGAHATVHSCNSLNNPSIEYAAKVYRVDDLEI